jgi:hypothetical protein
MGILQSTRHFKKGLPYLHSVWPMPLNPSVNIIIIIIIIILA